MVPPPELKFIEANGLRFAYFEQGQGPLVLLLHGFPDTAHSWDGVRPALAEAGYRAVSPFSRGYFPTAVPADGRYDIESLGRDALALIAALGQASAILVGHDWGAAAVHAAAVLAPERVRLLVTVAIPHPASLRPSPRLLWGGRHLFRFRLPDAEAAVRARDFAYVDRLLRRWSPAWNVPPGETMHVKRCFRHPGSLAAALGYYRALGLTVPKVLRHKITVPSVAFSGDDDGVLRHRDFARARPFYLNRYEVVQMPGGHFLHREHPERFLAELLRVLPRPG